jgi:hypothetical protein
MVAWKAHSPSYGFRFDRTPVKRAQSPAVQFSSNSRGGPGTIRLAAEDSQAHFLIRTAKSQRTRAIQGCEIRKARSIYAGAASWQSPRVAGGKTSAIKNQL